MSLPQLLLQIGLILVLARLLGWIFEKFRQPQVVGEMIAGILLGPSLLGLALPRVSAALFPPDGLVALNALSQVGLIIFMFLVGLELDPKFLHGRGYVVVVTSHVSIIVPFILGSLLALYLYPTLSAPAVPLIHFVLFLGIAMSITAFPVLARILTERNMLHTRIGGMAIACAAVDDVTAWCVLAGIILIVRATNGIIAFVPVLLGCLVYIAIMLWAVQRVVRKLETNFNKHGLVSRSMLALIFLLILASAWVTETIGIHPLFGAFLMGMIMPKEREFVAAISSKLEDLTVVVLLPLFFAFTGLRTSISLLSSTQMWLFCAIIVLVAIIGKFGGAAISAKVFGMSWREAGAIGTLMNTRGLIELVVLNIGLDLGVISSTLFTMMVFMALVTTVMTTPILEWIYPTKLLHQEMQILPASSPDFVELD